jgi:hypothetical protein
MSKRTFINLALVQLSKKKTKRLRNKNLNLIQLSRKLNKPNERIREINEG